MRFRFRLPRQNRGTWLVAAVLSVVAVVVAAYAYHEANKPSVGNFVRKNVGTLTATAPPKVAKSAKKFIWPIYGFNDARTRVFNGPRVFNTPSNFYAKWRLSGNAPLEFPPVIDGNVLFFLDDHGTLNKVNLTTGHRYWREHFGIWSASTPGLDPKLGLVFVSILSKDSDTPGDGEFVAVSMKKGTAVWTDPVSAGTESSPLIWGNNVYFGDSGGTMHDVNPKTGATKWTFPTAGPIKGGPTLAGGVLYFANYSGQVFAVNASTGKQIWASNVSGPVYGSPTVYDGRLFFGTNAGGFYSLYTKNGQVAWSKSAGTYVYSSAAVDDVPGLGPVVYFGTYDGIGAGYAFALNASNGSVIWEKDFGNSISGAASIVNDTVFFSGVYPQDGTNHSVTRGYNLRTGAQVFYFPDGAYTATVASPKAIILSGHYVLYGLFPKH